jgi:hypothetical protein
VREKSAVAFTVLAEELAGRNVPRDVAHRDRLAVPELYVDVVGATE